MKKSFWQITCTLLILVMMLSACSSGGGGSASSNPTSGAAAQTAAGSAKAPAEVKNINVLQATFGGPTQSLPEIQEALNAYTKDKIGVTATIQFADFMTYAQKLSMMIASGEEVDLCDTTMNQSFPSMVGQGQLMALDDLLDKYGQDIKNALGSEMIKGGMINGKIYEITLNSPKVFTAVLHWRKDIAEELGLNFDDIKAYEDLGAIWEKVHAAHPEMACITGTSAGGAIWGSGIDYMDTCGDMDHSIGVLIGNDNYNIVDWYETPQYKKLAETAYKWSQAGYISKDDATSGETGDALYTQGKVFAYINVDYCPQYTKSYDDPRYTGNFGWPTMSRAMSSTPMITVGPGFYCQGIPTSSKYPEAAMKWWNLMYADEHAANLLYWGIEGSDYVKNSDGTVSYPEGITTANMKWNTTFSWSLGNMGLQYVLKEVGPADYYKKLIENNKTATYSTAYGYQFDPTAVNTQYTAVINVLSQYVKPLGTGVVNPDEKLPEFISKLKEAGIDDVLAEKQSQLNAWVEKNKK